jgi:phage terminase large subunit-like protein
MPTVDPRWIRNPSDTLAIERGCWFDESVGGMICDFIETFCVQSQDRWDGQPIKLLDWERDFTMRLFGWRKPDGRRRFTSAYLEIAKKNGKSTYLAALEITLIILAQGGAPEIHINACDREQASIIFNESTRMIRRSPSLSSRFRIVDSRKRILHPANNGLIRANSADADNKDGGNPAFVFFDELHRQPDYKLWDVYVYAMAARSEPLTVSITTAGETDSGPWYDQRKLSEDINAGLIPVIDHLGAVYRCDPADDLDDPAVWRKANPSLGITIDVEKFREEWEAAKRDPRKRALFRRLRFNILTNADESLFDLDDWDACDHPTDLDALNGRVAYVGGDLSRSIDLTAAVAAIPDDDGVVHLIAQFWIPRDELVRLEDRDRVPYGAWAESGWVELTPGRTVDYQYVRRWINGLAGQVWDEKSQRYKPGPTPQRFAVARIGLDPWQADELAKELAHRDGFGTADDNLNSTGVLFIRQGFRSLSAPTKTLEALIKNRKIAHGGNPVLRWCVANVIADEDAAGNIKMNKKKSRAKIAGAAATVNAVAMLPEPSEPQDVLDSTTLLMSL